MQKKWKSGVKNKLISQRFELKKLKKFKNWAKAIKEKKCYFEALAFEVNRMKDVKVEIFYRQMPVTYNALLPLNLTKAFCLVRRDCWLWCHWLSRHLCVMKAVKAFMLNNDCSYALLNRCLQENVAAMSWHYIGYIA